MEKEIGGFMKKALGILIVALLSIIVTSNAYAKPSYNYLKSMTVYIKGCAQDCQEDICKDKCWVGTGVVYTIKDGYTYILTNAHVAGKDEVDPQISVENIYDFIDADILAYDIFYDLALLRVPNSLYEKQPIKSIWYGFIQDSVFVVGHHLGRRYVYGEGVIAGYTTESMIVQVPCDFGNSGSGIFDEDGNLVGLVYAINGINYFSYDVAHALAIDGINIMLFIDSIPELKE